MEIDNLAKMIDHTLLKADATKEDIEILCQEANKFKFASVCVNPTHVKLCTQLLADSEVAVCTVIGFPLGANLTEIKVAECKKAIEDGASEVDMVINIGALKNKNYTQVQNDISEVANAKGENCLKVIIETALLTDEEKIRACELAKRAGANFVKTSTGFSTGGATVDDIKLMRKAVGPDMGIKASGGVRTQNDAISMIKAGATRIGASSSIKIVTNGEE